MIHIKIPIILFLLLLNGIKIDAQSKFSKEQVSETMLKATRYMVETVSMNGGYVWYYVPDFSRQWGEMEAYKTMIWLQHPGTVSMGHLFLDAYRVTENEYYYQAAQKAAAAIIWGQSHEGGWNYMIDFAGDRSLKQWYNTIGKNGWRLEEFQHYYGNSTFDDDITSDAARFLMRMYLEKMDPTYKPALDKAIGFILKSQYPIGGWPQRYPLKYDFNKQGHPDYTSYYTFNDDVIWENIHFLIQCYLALGEERFLDPIQRGMNFYLTSQNGCGAWGQQINLNMETAGARTYEPTAFLPGATCENAMLLLKFYQYTGDKKFLTHVPDAIKWLEDTKLPANQIEEWRTHPTFIDPATNKPIYVHRKGSNVIFGSYYVDDNDKQLLAHYYGKCFVQLDELKAEYKRLLEITPEEATKNSPLKTDSFRGSETPQRFYDLNRNAFTGQATELQVEEIIHSLDYQNRWLTKHAYISNPYIGDGLNKEQTDKYATTRVGDESDTSPYPDPSDNLYISSGDYIRNMNLLISYLKKDKSSTETSDETFPDGTKIPDWFSDVKKIELDDLGTLFRITDFGAVNDSTVLQTAIIQKTIDEAHKQGGGVIVVPKGTFLSGALFFKPNTHLYISEGGVLKGSDDIVDYPFLPSRIEGQSIDYFSALINAWGVDGFSISGKGTIDGNGLKYWKAFWQRRKENPQCTNLEVSRPRLVFIWNCNNVQIQDVKLVNSGFWSSHYYKCNKLKILDVHISSPHQPVKAPSTDAIDIDVCSNVLIKGCYMAVNDDAIALKGGKGPWADTDSTNGENTNIIIDDCEFGFCHAALTCGSEAIHIKNIVMRNCYVNDAVRLLWLKMRPDTPQKYEFITVENIKGKANSMIYVKPWTQFFDLKGKTEVPLSYSENITMKNIELKCDIFFDIAITEYDRLSNFTFENLKIETKNGDYNKDLINGITLTNVRVNGKLIE